MQALRGRSPALAAPWRKSVPSSSSSSASVATRSSVRQLRAFSCGSQELHDAFQQAHGAMRAAALVSGGAVLTVAACFATTAAVGEDATATKCEALGRDEMHHHALLDLQQTQRDEDAALLLASTAAARPQRKEDEGGAATAEVQDPGSKPVVAPAAPLSVDELAAARKALRKRKTSSGKDRFIVSSAAVRGDRATMEDVSFVSDCKRFAAVFDGHGGAAVAQYLHKHYFALLGPELAKLDEEDESAGLDAKKQRRVRIQALLKTSMEAIDAEVAQRDEWRSVGSTAAGVLLYDDVIYSVNVGDCRAVLSRSGDAVELTRDHKPNDPREQSRIESLGGRVRWHGYVDAQGAPIEPYGAYRINGNLAVARAVGDRDLRPFVTGEPEVLAFARDATKDEFIVLASDGLWDVFTSDQVVTFVKDVLSGEVGARESWRSGGHSDTRVPIFAWSQQYKSDRGLIKAARKRRQAQIAAYLVQEALYRGTSDNVSVIVLWLR